MGNTFDPTKAQVKISKRKKKKYFQKLENTIESIVIVDQKEMCVFANDSFVRMMGGRSKDQIIGFGISAFSPPTQPHLGKDSSLAAMECVHKTITSEQGCYDFDWEHIDMQQNHFFAHVWASFISLDGEPVIQAVVRKTTRIRKTKEKLDTPTQLRRERSTRETDSERNFSAPSEALLRPKFDDSSESSQFSQSTNEMSTKLQNLVVPEDDNHQDIIDRLKEYARSSDNIELEKKMVSLLNDLETCFDSAIKTRNEHIQKLHSKIEKERKANRSKYSELESHLQKRLRELDVEREQTKTIIETNKFLNERMKKQNVLIQKLKPMVDELFEEVDIEDSDF
ncbi:jm1 protein [Anaeramoeba ignava]|uniref:Jm1 protein n=1 Tax=Anaeramoeba ignava TaxID=1746090 RepID=A0A9Q0LJV4_ANAIG|nr:jm1 protein [Anaeramoeba ignava]|eukprot:Anaeramoba_ignava/c17499_g1_i1.p1 GENE.c17499_g1_i1~~c17499_g1_i1.p1  ORF type:complete len:339 (-),score=104.85 c17499_g1_i1:62-1078(-)